MALENLRNKIKKVQEVDIPVAYQNAIIDNEEVIKELLREQLASGISGSGDPIMLYDEPGYHPFTIKYKKIYGSGLGAITDHITLYMFGSFYGRLFMTIKGSEFNIKSDVPYFGDIIRKSGSDVMKLNATSMDILLRYHVNPQVEKELEKYL